MASSQFSCVSTASARLGEKADEITRTLGLDAAADPARVDTQGLRRAASNLDTLADGLDQLDPAGAAAARSVRDMTSALSDAEIEKMLTRAAEQGAKRALADVGLDGKDAALDIRDLRSLLECLRFVRRTAVQTSVRIITTGAMLALLAEIAISSRSSAAVRKPLRPP
jgi:hypothetical protein